MIVLILTLALGLLAGCDQAPATAAPTTTVPATVAAPSVSNEAAQAVTIKKVTADEALAILKDQPQAVLLDVRTEAEFAEGHIEGAQQLAVEELLDRTEELPTDKSIPLVVYCRSGRRSALAAEQLAELGYTTIYDLGGITSWPYEVVK
ncbi:MAG: rhodanese-like domain-containing protein [Clostridia bacterium]|nr:rhodanese-like domain-containing protein [Clostridia bacterium]